MRNAAEPVVGGISLDALTLLVPFHEIAVDPAQIRHRRKPAQVAWR